MFLIRDVFNTKPGKAKDFVAKVKKAMPHMDAPGLSMRVMTDTVGGYWTVVCETEVEELQTYFDAARPESQKPEAEEAMKGYMDLVNGGYREIFRIE